jgi:hypothetical protein
MEYKIGIQDALVLRSMLLEAGGSYADITLARKAAEDVFSTEKLADYQVRNTPQGVFWNLNGKDGKGLPDTMTVELGPETVKLVANMLRKLDEAKALLPYHVGLYEMFVLKPSAS